MADESKEPQVKFRHMEEEKWHEVRAIELPSGRAVVREKWLEFSDKCLSLVARWDPGMMIHKHGHNSEHEMLSCFRFKQLHSFQDGLVFIGS